MVPPSARSWPTFTKSLAVAAAEPSSLAIVSLDESGAASYRFDIDGTADWQWTETDLPTTLPTAETLPM